MPDTAPAWPELAQRLAERMPGEVSACHALIVQKSRKNSIGIAVSGGADSVCLALIAWVALGAHREQFTILHFNHCQRGADSDGDADFVEGMAKSLGLGYRLGQSTLPSGTSINEAVLREERLAFFKASGCGVILQGHQRDDILETQLMRLCRGSGTDGLAAPRPVSRLGDGLVLMRPLLDVGRDAIRAALHDCGIPWREDASNAGDDFLRNRIRRDVVPALRESTGREPSEGAALSRLLLEEDAMALDLLVQELYPNGFGGELLVMPKLRKLPAAVLRRAFHAWLGHHGIVAERSQMVLLLDAAQGEGPTIVTLAGGRQVEVCLEFARFLPEKKQFEDWGPLDLFVGEAVRLPSGAILEAQRVPLDADLYKKITTGKVDAGCECYVTASGQLPSVLVIRAWLQGDRYQALGAPGSRKISDMFIDAKVPQRERKARPLVCWDDAILWIPGFPPAEAYRITTGTEWALRLTYRVISENI